ncbi:MAG: fibrillarin-like rRNA/tRNA 2'-O-methyltransferase [Candidatus Aenigmarchaeota archaeon]|nr:fibrillarin-like rRNA/tRNA 2'-O-methyltransferase [Candidatus Aenigmarchaeota archaeon]
MNEIFPGIFKKDNKLYTLNSIKNYNPFGEELININKKQYRNWNPMRSKAAAAILKGIKIFPIKKGSIVLYLGGAHGYTISFLSDIIGQQGIIYAIEFSERCFNELLTITEKYNNIVPICADARKIEEYKWIEPVDVIYCDIAQIDQTKIAIRNAKEFLKKDGYLMISIKTQSIDVTKPAKQIVKQEIKLIEDAGFEIIDWKMLDPYEAKHGFIIARQR